MKRALTLFFGIAALLACEELLEVPNISEQQVQILAPVNGSIVTDSIVRLSWEGLSDAEGYVVQVAQPSFGNAAQLTVDTILPIDTTFVGTRLTTRLPNNSYEWRVKAFNSGFETEFALSAFEVNR
ncbi:fibronectin type III domain-containing protein [Flagellimonas meridianipacifica]|uniref:Fibronectin type-III domain-containing protein n=1 Tax=Flagellimonas meridianipacifica TaxID=1080225 RepID=A0A2T0MI02_9FLAO|nr:fibronectin type III domain-containing protein [Allomuricauda pacifica]PRX57192.1 hypothetical protein CLV81_1195 [Allomuricauda pacifica]